VGKNAVDGDCSKGCLDGFQHDGVGFLLSENCRLSRSLVSTLHLIVGVIKTCVIVWCLLRVPIAWKRNRRGGIIVIAVCIQMACFACFEFLSVVDSPTASLLSATCLGVAITVVVLIVGAILQQMVVAALAGMEAEKAKNHLRVIRSIVAFQVAVSVISTILMFLGHYLKKLDLSTRNSLVVAGYCTTLTSVVIIGNGVLCRILAKLVNEIKSTSCLTGSKTGPNQGVLQACDRMTFLMQQVDKICVLITLTSLYLFMTNLLLNESPYYASIVFPLDTAVGPSIFSIAVTRLFTTKRSRKTSKVSSDALNGGSRQGSTHTSSKPSR